MKRLQLQNFSLSNALHTRGSGENLYFLESETNDEAEDSSRSTKIHWQDYFSENFKDASNEVSFDYSIF